MTTLRRRLVGLVAVVGILVIIVGLPVVLFAVGANPFEAGAPSWSDVTTALTSPDDGSLAVAAIKLVAWLAWALLTLSLLVEIGAKLRGVRAPPMPGLRAPQAAARGLVGAAVMLFVAIPAANVANAAPASAGPAHAAEPIAVQTIAQPAAAATAADDAHEHTAATSADERTRTSEDAATTSAPKTVTYTVQQGDSLWGIAEAHLGDGHRYKEIVHLNPTVLDGKASFIKAGWELQIPAPKAGKGTDQGSGKDETGAGKKVTVERGDTLSSIAKAELGAADRYPEIVDASRDIEQPGGVHLSDPDVIDVGWTVQIPGQAAPSKGTTDETSAPTKAKDAHAGEDTTTAAQERTDAVAQAAGELAEAASAVGQAADDAESAAQAQAEDARAQAVAEAAQERAEQAPAPVEVADTTDATETADSADADADQWIARTSYGVGAILAAGVLGLVIARRRNQQRRRQPGQRMPTHSLELVETESELRTTADSLSIETVDTALRALARHCTTEGTALPDVRAARLTATQFDLYLAEPTTLPAPWIGTDDQTVWRLDTDHTPQTAPDVAEATPAPYPALVTIGHDEEDGHVFLNLEHLGALAITGDDQHTREILAALAIELALSTWADDLQVTLVGAFPELEDTLQTGRIRYLPTIGRLVDHLATRAADDRAALAEAGVGDLNAARAAGTVPDAWTPEIVLLGGNITDKQRNELAGFIDELPRVALAAVTSGEHITSWGLDLADSSTGGDVATLAPIGLELRPQRLPSEQYGHLLELAAMTDVEELEGEPVRDPSLAEVESVVPVDDPADERAVGSVSAIPDLQDDVLHAPADVDDVDQADEDEHAAASAAEGETVAVVAVTEPETSPGAPAVAVASDAAVEAGEEAAADVVELAPAETAEGVDEPAAATEPDDEPADEDETPRVVVLGPVDLLNPGGKVEPSKRARLLEYATYLALHPGATHTAIDDAIWPDRRTEDNLNTRNTATSKLRRWVGKTPDGQDYLPPHQAGEGYAFHPDVTTDAAQWDTLIVQDPINAPTENLENALQLVRGMPFQGTHRRRYAWAEPIKRRLIAEIVDASYELARRRLMDGRWRAAEQAVVVGLSIEPAQENLWRLRILAAHESHNAEAEAEAINRLLTVTEQLECDLEPETEQLLAALKNPGIDFDRLMATAL
ncbi:LysM peptidoglycan-binding domain-containing protein [Isoptericola sp. NPDC056605]|uniref:LysM peptidoglycan-binding domain-containing protein n=1 Tax=Isoptericola sp. NPDC056605 TaxID=3345876 RepID=UPI0036CF7D13